MAAQMDAVLKHIAEAKGRKVDAGRILHCAKQVGWSRTVKLPTPRVLLEFVWKLRARLQFDNDPGCIDGAIAIFGQSFQRVIKVVVLDVRARHPRFLRVTGTNMLARGRNVRCNPKQY